VDDQIRSKMHEALDVELPDRGMRSRIISSLPTGEAAVRRFRDAGEPGELRGAWRWLAGGIAAVLALSVVGGLVFSHFASSKVDGESRGNAAVTGVDFTCRLPVLAGATAGFISFPDGAVTIDPRVTLNYKGGYPYTYDTQVGRWVPVPRTALSPDGRSYAYLAQTTGVPGAMNSMSLHTHEIVSGKDRVLWEGSGSPMGSNVTWLPTGIYFLGVVTTADMALGPTYPAVYVADPIQPGTPRRVGPNPPPQPPTPGVNSYSSPDMFNLVGPGAAWGTGNRVPKETPSPDKAPAPGTYGPDRVLHMDLRDGTVSTWYTVIGTDLVSVMGLDAQGRPILALYQFNMKTAQPPASDGPPKVRVFLLTGPNQTLEITTATSDFRLGSQPLADAHGIWFGGWNSVWFYATSGGLRQVATIADGVFPTPTPPPGYPMKGAPASGGRSGMPPYMLGTLISPAGPCA